MTLVLRTCRDGFAVIGADQEWTNQRDGIDGLPSTKVVTHPTLLLAFAAAGTHWWWTEKGGNYTVEFLRGLASEIQSESELVFEELGQRILEVLQPCEFHPKQIAGITIALVKNGQLVVGLQNAGTNCALAIGEFGKPVAPVWMKPEVYNRIHDPAARKPEQVSRLIHDVMSETIAEALRRPEKREIGCPIDIVTMSDKVTVETFQN